MWGVGAEILLCEVRPVLLAVKISLKQIQSIVQAEDT